MAICDYCLGEMNEVDGCKAIVIKVRGGKELQPIRYGSETPKYYEGPNPQHCHDCNAKIGNYHHVGCDWEECPNCEEQLLSCDCEQSETDRSQGDVSHA